MILCLCCGPHIFTKIKCKLILLMPEPMVLTLVFSLFTGLRKHFGERCFQLVNFHS